MRPPSVRSMENDQQTTGTGTPIHVNVVGLSGLASGS
jgi:hypothetical protein